MDIREAIEKAGPGGKIRRHAWIPEVPSMVIPHDDSSSMRYEKEYPAGQFMSTGYLTATDWEVVEPEQTIEVGDVVKVSNWTETGIVIAIQKNRSYACIEHMDELDVVKFDRLTLIRKGNTLRVDLPEGTVSVWSAAGNRTTANFTGLDPDKTYGLEVKERPDVS